MAYLVNKTDGTLLATVFDGQTDSPNSPSGHSSITLIGKQVSNYGEIQNENFVRIMENFSNTASPPFPIEGQLWWSKEENVMNVYDGAAWYPVTGFTTSATTPLTPRNGDQWWDTANEQYKIYNGTEWISVGPAYSKLDGKSGAIVENVYDLSGNKKTIVKVYHNANVTAIVSRADAFTPNVAISGFTTIRPGISFTSAIDAIKFYGTATNADTLGNLTPSQYLRSDVDTVSTANVSVRNNFYVGANAEFKTSVSGGDLTLTNNSSNKNISLVANVGGTLTPAMVVNGTTGLITVHGNPTTSLGVATKGYVDTNLVSFDIALSNSIISNVNTLNDAIVSNVSNLQSEIDSTNAAVALRANIASPTFTGIPQAPTPDSGNNSTQIATTAYVATTAGTLNTALLANVSTLQTKLDSANAAILLRANIASPTFTGIPKSVTPLAGDNSSNIATTQYVTSAISSFDTTRIYNGATYVKANSNNIELVVSGTTIVTVNSTAAYVSTPAANDNSTKIATTAYVDRATKNYVLNSTSYAPTVYVSASAPNNGTGVEGDIWYQYQG